MIVLLPIRLTHYSKPNLQLLIIILLNRRVTFFNVGINIRGRTQSYSPKFHHNRINGLETHLHPETSIFTYKSANALFVTSSRQNY